MKKSIFSAVFMAGAMAISLTALLNAQNPVRPAATTASAPTTTGGGTSVAVIDIKQIFENHPRFKGEMEAIAKEAKQFDEYAMEQRSKLQKQSERLRGLESGTPDYRRLEEEIAKVDTDMKVSVARKQRELVEKRSRVFFEAYKEIESHVVEFAERNGIDLVLRFDSTEMEENNRESIYQGVNKGVVFQKNRDITRFIRERLERANPVVKNGGVPGVGGAAPVAPRVSTVPGTPRPVSPPGGVKR